MQNIVLNHLGNPEGLSAFCFTEPQEQVAQRGSGCSIPGTIGGQVRQGSEQPDLAENVPAYGREVGLGDL